MSHPQQPTVSPLLLVSLLLLMIIIASLLHFSALNTYNTQFFLALNQWGTMMPDRVWVVFTTLGNKMFALSLLLIVAWKYPKLLLVALLAIISEIVFSTGLKTYFDAPRPTDLLEVGRYHLIGDKVSGHSFPSGHTMSAFAVAAAIGLYSSRRSVLLVMLLLASLSGLSRIMIGVHWPADVTLGAALGIACGYIALLIAQRITLYLTTLKWLVYSAYLLISIRLLWYGTYYDGVQLAVKIVAIIALLVSGYCLVTMIKQSVYDGNN